MLIPFFDINNHFSVTHLPKTKRLRKWIQTIRGYLGAITLLDSIFRKFFNGSDDLTFYDSTFTYAKYDRVKDNFAVYESLKDNNLNNLTSDNTSWVKILDYFIGTIERVSYSSRRLVLEYALNHYFQQQLIDNGFVGWKQPTAFSGDMYDPVSDIYVEPLIPTDFSICGFDDLQIQNSIYDDPINYYAFDDLIFIASSFYQFTINVPTAVYNSLGATNSIRDSVIKKFMDKLLVSGTYYTIVTY